MKDELETLDKLHRQKGELRDDLLTVETLLEWVLLEWAPTLEAAANALDDLGNPALAEATRAALAKVSDRIGNVGNAMLAKAKK